MTSDNPLDLPRCPRHQGEIDVADCIDCDLEQSAFAFQRRLNAHHYNVVTQILVALLTADTDEERRNYARAAIEHLDDNAAIMVMQIVALALAGIIEDIRAQRPELNAHLEAAAREVGLRLATEQ